MDTQAGLWERWAPGPPVQPAAVGDIHKDGFVYTGDHGPCGRVCYLQAGQQADSHLWPQRTWQAAFVGGLTRPGRRGAWSTFFPLTASPVSPGNWPGQPLRVPPHSSHQRNHEADVRPEGMSWGHRSRGNSSWGAQACSRGLPPTRPLVAP